MFNAGKDTAPVRTKESLVNDSIDLYVDSVTGQDLVIDPT